MCTLLLMLNGSGFGAWLGCWGKALKGIKLAASAVPVVVKKLRRFMLEFFKDEWIFLSFIVNLLFPDLPIDKF
jgi:hypothetical protein